MKSHIRVVIVNTAADCVIPDARALHNGLRDAGYDNVVSVPADIHLPGRIAQIQPDLIIIVAQSDAPQVLEQIVVATRNHRRPIVLFTEDKSKASIDAAMEAGVSAYIVDGLRAERVKPVLEVALARFRQEQKLHAELSDAKHKLAERKLIERAKGLLMARQGLTEQQAWEKLRNTAMNKKQKLADIAQRILDIEDLLG